jgi:hypothetical protein
MRDTAFKRSLKRLPLGTGVKIDSPVGSFTLHKNSAKPAVFLAGGIGITPFFSIRTCGEFDSSRKTVKKKRGLVGYFGFSARCQRYPTTATVATMITNMVGPFRWNHEPT